MKCEFGTDVPAREIRGYYSEETGSIYLVVDKNNLVRISAENDVYVFGTMNIAIDSMIPIYKDTNLTIYFEAE